MTDSEATDVLDGWGADQLERYGDSEELYAHELSSVEASQFEPPEGVFLVVVDVGLTVAGGALRRLTSDTCEVKRMWTAPDHRRKGHASVVLDALEAEARTLGYSALRLETGPAQPEACSLYDRRYRRIPAYHYEEAIAFEHPLR
jgi:GNAT superfamily N-acetyltransferase